MAVIANRRSVMTLFSRPTDIHSHRTRLVLAEKNINIEISTVFGNDLPEDLMDLNPYHTVPTLVDRDLTLYDSRVIIEYLDERFPHPPLMPVDPVMRAQFRLALFRIETDWYSLAEEAETNNDGKLGSRSTRLCGNKIRCWHDQRGSVGLASPERREWQANWYSAGQGWPRAACRVLAR